MLHSTGLRHHRQRNRLLLVLVVAVVLQPLPRPLLHPFLQQQLLLVKEATHRRMPLTTRRSSSIRAMPLSSRRRRLRLCTDRRLQALLQVLPCLQVSRVDCGGLQRLRRRPLLPRQATVGACLSRSLRATTTTLLCRGRVERITPFTSSRTPSSSSSSSSSLLTLGLLTANRLAELFSRLAIFVCRKPAAVIRGLLSCCRY